jgi:hypothetical protein
MGSGITHIVVGLDESGDSCRFPGTLVSEF